MNGSRRPLRRALPVDPVMETTAAAASESMTAAQEDPERLWRLQELVDGHWVDWGMGRGPLSRRAWLAYQL